MAATGGCRGPAAIGRVRGACRRHAGSHNVPAPTTCRLPQIAWLGSTAFPRCGSCHGSDWGLPRTRNYRQGARCLSPAWRLPQLVAVAGGSAPKDCMTGIDTPFSVWELPWQRLGPAEHLKLSAGCEVPVAGMPAPTDCMTGIDTPFSVWELPWQRLGPAKDPKLSAG